VLAINNPDLKVKMTEAGVVGSPRIEINEEVESIEKFGSPDPGKGPQGRTGTGRHLIKASA